MNIVRSLLGILLISYGCLVNSHPSSVAIPPQLLQDEKNTIRIYQHAAPNVVFVHRYQRVMDRSLQIFDVPAGSGSGFLWDKQGHVVTNYHVIKGSKHLAVTVNDMTSRIKVVGAEPRKDIAVLKIDSPKVLKKIATFPPLQMASHNNLLVGQKTIAIGNPFGLDHSLSTGVVSAVGRKVPGIAGTMYDMIQTDAAINPGNSGGPLLNSEGKVIGMNTAILSKTGSSSGVGFAVPTEDISRIVTQIIKHGRVILAGIGVQRIDGSTAENLGVNKGILVGQVLKNSPADMAGIQGTYRDGYGRIHLGDVIVAINGHPTPKYDDMYHYMSELKVGTPITITVLRNKHKKRIKVKTIDIAEY